MQAVGEAALDEILTQEKVPVAASSAHSPLARTAQTQPLCFVPQSASSRVVSIRWVLNHEPSWPQVHRGDYVTTDPEFKKGFAKLHEHGLNFDLQTNPHQLKDTAAFLAGFPDTKVVVNHIGCLKLPGDGLVTTAGDAQEKEDEVMKVWREGMAAMAALPQVYCKLSMLHYTLPFWWNSEEKKAKVKAIVLELIAMFGANRCMFASNYPADRVPEGTLKQHYDGFVWMVDELSFEDKKALFHDTAAEFYRIA